MNEILWRPETDTVRSAQVTRFAKWLEQTRGLELEGYESLWQWSVDEIDAFWLAIWDYYQIQPGATVDTVLSNDSMPGAQWFPGSTVNYTAHVFKNATADRPAMIFQGEATELQEISWGELEKNVAALANHLKSIGVTTGDRVAAYLPNTPEAVVAFLASASIGAIWSMCAPDLGPQGVLDRFRQIKPKLLIATDGYTYNGRNYDRTETVNELLANLPTVKALVAVDRIGASEHLAAGSKVPASTWADAVAGTYDLEPLPLPFSHPLWILYSSGTTGTPKAIVHSQGGILVEHLKALNLHLDLGAHDRFFWYSSTAWMMWNFHVSGLLNGTTICTYDGNPAFPNINRLWRFISESRVTYFGAGAAFYDSCRNAGISPQKDFDLGSLRGVGSTGSPLLPESYRWIFGNVGANVYLAPISGGTDFCSAFVGGVPTLPVRLGEMSCRCLGAAVAAFDDAGEPVIGKVGELVCTKPMPSMPVFFWNDEDNARYLDSYFDTWPGVWRHGDWIEITSDGRAIIYGRSDATINRYGIRMGTAELYAAVEALPEVMDSLVVDLEFLGRDSYMPLFVVLKDGQELSDELCTRIKDAVKTNLSPRHVPNDVFAIDDVPRTFSGKKLEIPVRKLLLGQPAEKVINRNTMGNPDSIDYFIEFAANLSLTPE
jgi:acetoacetyl-CoA synthetase